MRMTAGLAVVAAIIILVAIATLAMKRNSVEHISESTKTTHIVLIGASIGEGWHLADWPARANASGFSAESVPAWQFDKTEVVDEVLMRPSRKFHLTRTYFKSLLQPPPRKPDIVILKECSSYFPGDFPAYKRSIDKWIRQFQTNHTKVILATVVPVTRTRAQQSPGKQESLIEYNQWLRQYAQQHGITLLDLEAALCTEESGRYLQDEYAISDGSHLNLAAYAVLDKVLNQVLCGTGVGSKACSPAVAALL